MFYHMIKYLNYELSNLKTNISKFWMTCLIEGILSIYLVIENTLLYEYIGEKNGARGVMIIITGNGHSDQSSNPG